MKMIRARYSPATNTCGTRWVASDGDNSRMYAPYDYGDEDGHDGRLALAQRFAEKYWRLHGRKIEYLGSFKDERYYGIKES